MERTNKCNAVYAVMFFYHWSDFYTVKPDRMDYVLAGTFITRRFNDALYKYAETPCPASQLIEAKSTKELKQKMQEMEANFKNPEWLAELQKYL